MHRAFFDRVDIQHARVVERVRNVDAVLVEPRAAVAPPARLQPAFHGTHLAADAVLFLLGVVGYFDEFIILGGESYSGVERVQHLPRDRSSKHSAAKFARAL